VCVCVCVCVCVYVCVCVCVCVCMFVYVMWKKKENASLCVDSLTDTVKMLVLFCRQL